MGRGNTSSKSLLAEGSTGRNRSRSSIQTEHHSGWVGLITSGQIGSLVRSIVWSTDWMVLHRPVGLAQTSTEVQQVGIEADCPLPF